MINKGTVFKDINLNNLKVGQRYTITDVNGNVDRGTLSRIVPAAAAAPGVPEGPNQLIFDNVDGLGRMNIPANLVARIQQHNVGPNEDTGGLINEYIGGRRKKRTRRKGGARTKKNTKYFTDPKTLKKVINPSFVKSKPQPVTLNITGVGPVTFDPKEVAQQRRMMTQHKKLSPTGRKNRGGRRKKRTRRRRKSRRKKRGKKKTKKRRRRR